MASYNPGSYAPPQPAPPGTRSRGSSYTDKYRPRTYSDAPPSQPNPNLLGPYQQPMPSPGVAPYPAQAPTAAQQAPYGLNAYAPPQDRLEPHYPSGPDPHTMDDGYGHPVRPSHEHARQHSHTSHHSKRSHDSRRSHESSRHSRESRHSHRSRHHDDDVPESYGRHEKHHRSSHGSKSSKTSGNRPTLGGSLFSLFDLLKSALGPRDKY